MRKTLPLFALFIIFASGAFAQRRTYVNEYLNIGVGARALGMGGANVASASDVYAGYWNPAGLSFVQSNFDLGLMHSEYFAGIFKYDYGALAVPLKDTNRVLALSFIRFATDNIPYTLDYVQPDGSFDDSKLSSFSAGDYALYLSYAQKIHLLESKGWSTSIGGSAKILYRNVGHMANAWGFGLDLGFQMRNKHWRIGVALKDITTTYTAWSFHLNDHEKEVFENTGNEIPVKSYEVMLPRFNFGIGRTFFKPEGKFQLLAELGFDATTDGRGATLIHSNSVSIDPSFGLEASYKNAIFLRAGVRNIYQALDNTDTLNQSKYTVFQPSIGVGFKIKSLNIDYAFTSLQMQENPLMTHVISLHIGINKGKNTYRNSDTNPQMKSSSSNASTKELDKK